MKVGQIWKTRDRGTVLITGMQDHAEYPVVCDKRCFSLEGRYWGKDHPSVWDLVELVQDVAA